MVEDVADILLEEVLHEHAQGYYTLDFAFSLSKETLLERKIINLSQLHAELFLLCDQVGEQLFEAEFKEPGGGARQISMPA